jgi:hypothetical protein
MDSQSKNELERELALKTELYVDGANITPAALRLFNKDKKYQEQVHFVFEMDFRTHAGTKFPVGFYLPHGMCVQFKWNPDSKYTIHADNGHAGVFKNGIRVCDIEFLRRPGYYAKKTSDDQPMGNVGAFIPHDCLAVCYSNECALKEKGEDCRYCNINATKDTYGEIEGIFWKNPKQIGEVVVEAYSEGVAGHFNISGGFIPERREVDYYLDVADEIKDQTGLRDFHGTAVIGAPLDHSVIERYRDVGYHTMGINIEIWDRNIWKTICPGKDSVCGGWENWVNALTHAAKVFGKGHVRSNIVAGIEPKQKTLEGVEYLASRGVVCFAGPWCPNPGSALQGHRTPEPNWHLDLARKVVNIWKKHGFTYEQVDEVLPISIGIEKDVWKVEDGLPFEHGMEEPLIAG